MRFGCSAQVQKIKQNEKIKEDHDFTFKLDFQSLVFALGRLPAAGRSLTGGACLQR